MNSPQIGGVVAGSLAEVEKEHMVNLGASDVERSRFKRGCSVAKRALQTGVVITELSPANEVIRYGALAATLSQTQNPIAGAAVLGTSTFVVEGAAALATSGLLNTDTSSKTVSWVNRQLEKVVPTDARMNPLAEAGVAMYGGTAVVLMEKQREDPMRTIEQNRKHGLFTAGWLAGVLAVEGAMISKGIDDYNDPKTLGAVLIGLAGIGAGFRWAKRSLKKDTEVVTKVASDRDKEKSIPKYDLTPEELKQLENEMVEMAKAQFGDNRICAFWISPNHKFANFIRTHEKSYFSEVESLDGIVDIDIDNPDEEENGSVYLALVDTRHEIQRVVHGVDITGLRSKAITGEVSDRTSQQTGFYTIDSLIALGNFTTEEFYNYYENKGIDLDKCFSIETNFRIGEKNPRYKGFSSAQLAYRALYQLLEKIGANVDNSVFFASMNSVQTFSLRKVGIEFENLMGKEDYVTEESYAGIDSKPVSIENNEQLNLILSSIPEMPELFVR